MRIAYPRACLAVLALLWAGCCAPQPAAPWDNLPSFRPVADPPAPPPLSSKPLAAEPSPVAPALPSGAAAPDFLSGPPYPAAAGAVPYDKEVWGLVGAHVFMAGQQVRAQRRGV